jgi:hypothetical protein
MKTLALTLTIALATPACTIYFGPPPGDDDDDHPGWQADAGADDAYQSTDAQPWYPDADPWVDAGLPVADAQPADPDACNEP